MQCPFHLSQYELKTRCLLFPAGGDGLALTAIGQPVFFSAIPFSSRALVVVQVRVSRRQSGLCRVPMASDGFSWA